MRALLVVVVPNDQPASRCAFRVRRERVQMKGHVRRRISPGPPGYAEEHAGEIRGLTIYYYPDTLYLCQFLADMFVGAGDSGSPVFYNVNDSLL